MKITFDVWVNSKNEVHLTTEDPRLSSAVNIHARPGLKSTSVLRDALREDAELKAAIQAAVTEWVESEIP